MRWVLCRSCRPPAASWGAISAYARCRPAVFTNRKRACNSGRCTCAGFSSNTTASWKRLSPATTRENTAPTGGWAGTPWTILPSLSKAFLSPRRAITWSRFCAIPKFTGRSMATRVFARRTASFTESVIREMTRLAAQHDAVNLAQGYPDFPAPAELKAAAQQAICDDVNQYAITWGARNFRAAIAAKYRAWYGLDLDPEREITVCCGATEGMIASLLATINPGDEIIIFEPFYENYGPDAELCGASRRIVPLYPPDWRFDREELRRAFGP